MLTDSRQDFGEHDSAQGSARLSRSFYTWLASQTRLGWVRYHPLSTYTTTGQKCMQVIAPPRHVRTINAYDW